MAAVGDGRAADQSQKRVPTTMQLSVAFVPLRGRPSERVGVTKVFQLDELSDLMHVCQTGHVFIFKYS